MSIVIEILNALLEMFVVIFFFSQMLNRRKIKSFPRFIFIFCVSALHIIRSLVPLNTYVNIGITCVLWGIMLAFLYSDLITRKITVFALYFVSLLSADIFCRFIMSYMINSVYGPHAASPGLERYIGMLLSNVLMFSILSLFITASKHKNSDVPVKYQIMTALFPVFGLFISVCTDIFIMLSGTKDIKYIFALLFIIVGLLYFNVMTFEFTDTYSAKVRLAAAEELIRNQAESYKLLEINETELRKLRHNIGEHMEVIKELTAHGAFKDSEELAGSLEKISSVQTSLLYTGDVAIDAILNVEARKASNDGIKYLVKTQNLISPINIAAIDKSTILCNTINNAVEACLRVDDGERFIVIDISSNSDKVKICIENSSLPLNIKSNRIHSTKKDAVNHGLGIESVKSSLEKYNGAMSISYSDKVTICSMQFDNRGGEN